MIRSLANRIFQPRSVAWWVRRAEQAAEINSDHTNVAYLGPSCSLPPNLHATTDLEQATRGADVVVLGVPHRFLDGLY